MKPKHTPGKNSRHFNGGEIIPADEETRAAPQSNAMTSHLAINSRQWRHLHSSLWRRGNRHLVSAN